MHPDTQKVLEAMSQRRLPSVESDANEFLVIRLGILIASLLQFWLLYLTADNLVFLLRAKAVVGTVERHPLDRRPTGLASGNVVVGEKSYIKARLLSKKGLPEGTEVPILFIDGVQPQARIGGWRLWIRCLIPFVLASIVWGGTFALLLNAIHDGNEHVSKYLVKWAEWSRSAEKTVASCIGARVKRYFPDRTGIKPLGNQGHEKSDLR